MAATAGRATIGAMAVPLILDTDIDTDCDDAGTLALLHAFADRGDCALLGVVCSAPVAACPGAVRAINAWYGRPAIPVAAVRVPGVAADPVWQPYREHRARMRVDGQAGITYADLLAATRPAGEAPPEDAVALYRRLLAGAAPGSVVICGIGTHTALAQLLASGPDAISPLGGPALVARSVRELVCMAGGAYPAGRDGFNWRMDLPSAVAVAARWPTPLTVSAAGQSIMTGARFTAAAPADHPVAVAYRSFLGGPGRDRASWDQVTAWYAVHGLDGPYALGGPRRLAIDPGTGDHAWSAWDGVAAPRRVVVPAAADAWMAGAIEDLMLASLTGR